MRGTLKAPHIIALSASDIYPESSASWQSYWRFHSHKSARYRLGKIEDFLQHWKSLAGAGPMIRNKVGAHCFLPSEIHWILVNLVPHRIEVSFDMHVKK